MGTSVSPTQGLIQTILTIRGLQQQDAAAALAREQFGLAKAATGEQMLGHLATLAGSVRNAKVFLPHVDTMSQLTGLDANLLRTTFENAVPNEGVIKSDVVNKGVAAAGSAIDQPAAYAGLVGEQPGQLSSDHLAQTLNDYAQEYLQTQPPEKRKTFGAAVATKMGMGMSLKDALNQQLYADLPKEDQVHAVRIGAQLAPTAGEDIQGQLGLGQLAAQRRYQAGVLANEDLKTQAALIEAKSRLTGPKLTQVQDVIKQISDYQQFLVKNSGTFTEEGQVRNNAALNAMYQELHGLDPQIGSLFEPVPIDKPLSATSPFGAFLEKMRQKP